ncbi:MAG TPA: hypothetical protein VE127_01440 [Solirubrobacteraceae bacterium]|nr:hypothetical protein [Solirubrobacteraceae bacterium]
MLAAFAAGCGGGAAGAGNGTVAGGSAGGGTTSIHAKAVKFAECMRSNGVGAFPDPSASGSFTIDQAVNGSSLDPNSAAFKQAMSACKTLEPPGFTGAKVTPSQRTARLAFAACVRKHGVPDFPDPTPNGPLVDTRRIPSLAAEGGLTVLRAAMSACRNFAAAAGVTGAP